MQTELKYAERMVINGILADNTAYDDLGLFPNDFTDPQNREAFRIIQQVIESGKKADQGILWLDAEKKDSQVNYQYIASLDPVTAANLNYYAEIVANESIRRCIRKTFQWAVENIDGDPLIVIEGIEKRLSEQVNRSGDSIMENNEATLEGVSEIEKYFRNKGQIAGVSSGYKLLDTVLGGLEKADLVIIGARTSIGKTTFAVNMLTKQAREKGISVGFFSCEMEIKQLMLKVLSNLSNVELDAIKAGAMNQADFDRISDAAESWHEARVQWYMARNTELQIVKAKARQMARKGARVIYVDYITLIQYKGEKNMPKYEKIGQISKELKQLARELQVTIVALSQVGRQAEGRMPSLNDIRQSGEIEEDADAIIFMHRGRDTPTTNIKVAKNRKGCTGEISLYFDLKHQRYEMLNGGEE